jgi:hypothetical protein
MRRDTDVSVAPPAPAESNPDPSTTPTAMAARPAKRLARAAARALALAGTVALCAMLLPAVAEAADGAISGTVENAKTKTAAGFVEVCAVLEGAVSKECAAAEEEGEYVVGKLAPGKYEVEFTGDECFLYFYCEEIYSSSVTKKVEVKSDEITEGIDAELKELDGQISGRVTAGGSARANVEACTEDQCARTAANGEYTIEDVPPGSHTVSFSPERECTIICTRSANYLTVYWNGQLNPESAGTVTVDSEKTTTGINAELPAGGEISGKVTTASASPQSLGNFKVCAISTATSKEGSREEEEECALTNSSGEYTIHALGAHGYEVDFTGTTCEEAKGEVKCREPYVAQYYPGVVTVTPPGTVSGIDASVLEVTSTKPASSPAPTITGSTSVGSVLTCSQGSWTGNAASFAYKWLRNGSAIAGQTASTYTVQSADVGTAISCEVTATNAAGSTGATSSTLQIPKPAPGVAALVKITIKGSTVSVTLRCSGASGCTGALKLLAHKHNTSIAASVGFTIAAGKSVTLRVHLTRKGRKLLANAGKKGLTIQISGSGVKGQKSVLK